MANDKFLKSRHTILDPMEILLGTVDGKRCTSVNLPFLDVLHNTLSNQSVLKLVREPTKVTTGIYTSYRSGDIF
jgi:hypothetical protein